MGSSTSKAASVMSVPSGHAGQAAAVGAAGGRKLSRSGYDITPLPREVVEQLAAKISEQARYVTLKAGTEHAFSGKTINGYPHDNKKKGLYVSAITGLPVFRSETKFDSGTGWPSFYAPFDPEHVIEKVDRSIPFLPRTEILEARSGHHLGHVFNDGPRPTGKRYCMNAVALKFIPEGEELPPESRPYAETAEQAAPAAN